MTRKRHLMSVWHLVNVKKIAKNSLSMTKGHGGYCLQLRIALQHLVSITSIRICNLMIK